jgi:hypothetical protein
MSSQVFPLGAVSCHPVNKKSLISERARSDQEYKPVEAHEKDGIIQVAAFQRKSYDSTKVLLPLSPIRPQAIENTVELSGQQLVVI